MHGPKNSLVRVLYRLNTRRRLARNEWDVQYWEERDGQRVIPCRRCPKFDAKRTECVVPFGTPLRKCVVAATEAHLRERQIVGRDGRVPQREQPREAIGRQRPLFGVDAPQAFLEQRAGRRDALFVTTRCLDLGVLRRDAHRRRRRQQQGQLSAEPDHAQSRAARSCQRRSKPTHSSSVLGRARGMERGITESA